MLVCSPASTLIDVRGKLHLKREKFPRWVIADLAHLVEIKKTEETVME